MTTTTYNKDDVPSNSSSPAKKILHSKAPPLNPSPLKVIADDVIRTCSGNRVANNDSNNTINFNDGEAGSSSTNNKTKLNKSTAEAAAALVVMTASARKSATQDESNTKSITEGNHSILEMRNKQSNSTEKVKNKPNTSKESTPSATNKSFLGDSVNRRINTNTSETRRQSAVRLEGRTETSSVSTNETGAAEDPAFHSLAYVANIFTYHIEDLQDKMFRSRENRQSQFDAIKLLWKMYHDSNLDRYNRRNRERLHCRYLIAEVLSLACSFQPSHLSRWNAPLWAKLILLLDQVKEKCKKKSSMIFVANNATEGPNHRSDESVLKNEQFWKEFDAVIRACEVNKCFVPIREELLKSSNTPVPKDLEGLFTTEQPLQTFESISEEIKSKIRNLLHLNEHGVLVKRKDPATIRSILKGILEGSPLDLEKVQNDVELNLLTLIGKIPCPKRQKFRWPIKADETSDESSDDTQDGENLLEAESMLSNHNNTTPALQIPRLLPSAIDPVHDLRQKSEKLILQHGVDPIIESRIVAKNIARDSLRNSDREKALPSDVIENEVIDGCNDRGVDNSAGTLNQEGLLRTKRRFGGNNLYRKKKTAQRLEFDDEEIEKSIVEDELVTYMDEVDKDGVERGGQPVNLNSPSATIRVRSASSWAENDPKPDPEIFDKWGKVIGRRKFTEEEKIAVKEGFKLFGTKWVEIKNHNPITLRNRTNVQLKDCYRTMVKKGEID